MSLLEQLKKGGGVRLLTGVQVWAEKTGEGRWRFRVEFAGQPGDDDYVLLGVHYLSHILARYSPADPKGYELGTTLRDMLTLIVNEGVWPGSDLLRYAGVQEEVALVDSGGELTGEKIVAGLIVPPGGDGPDLVLEEPLKVAEEGVVFSVVALLQALLGVLSNEGIETFDRALRYFVSYLDEGATCSNPASACNLANRALRESKDR